MKPFKSACLALASAATVVAVASASRPHYGGALRVEIAGVIRSVDPAAQPADPAEAWAKSRVTRLVFETLTTIDPDAGLQPGLAAMWEAAPGNARWRFRIRRGVMLHDGSTLQAWQVAASIRAANPSWAVDADGDVVIVSLDRASADLPWELARPRHAVVVRTSAGALVGSGAFRIERTTDARLTLRAHDRYWGARPFLDAVQIEMGRLPADQLASVERGAADLVSVRPTDTRRVAQRGLRFAASRPLELIALVFEPHRATGDEAAVRSLLSGAIDRTALCAILLQQHGDPAEALLPAWLSGYAFPSLPIPRPSRADVSALPPAQRTLTIRVDPGDAVAQAIADRVVVNAREVGFSIAVQAPSGLAPRPDARIVRLPLEPTTPDRALAGVVTALGTRVTALATNEAASPAGSGVEGVYRAERALLEHRVILPLVHLPDIYAIGDRVHVWNGPLLGPSGGLNLANVWIE